MGEKFKVAFSLDEADAEYFRSLYRKAKKGAAGAGSRSRSSSTRAASCSACAARRRRRASCSEAIDVLADLVDLIQDEDYAAPQRVKTEVLAGLAYFSEPEDLIPDHVPGLGFLDDAIMVKFIEEEFRHELWGYRQFRKLRDFVRAAPVVEPGERAPAPAARRRSAAHPRRDRGAQGEGRQQAQDGAFLRVVTRAPTPAARDPKPRACPGSWSSTTRKRSSRR